MFSNRSFQSAKNGLRAVKHFPDVPLSSQHVEYFFQSAHHYPGASEQVKNMSTRQSPNYPVALPSLGIKCLQARFRKSPQVRLK